MTQRPPADLRAAILHLDALAGVPSPDVVQLLVVARDEGIALAVLGEGATPDRFRLDDPGASAEFDLVVDGTAAILFEPPYARYERALEERGVPAERGLGRFLFHDVARTLYVDAEPASLLAAGALGLATLAVQPERPETVISGVRAALGV